MVCAFGALSDETPALLLRDLKLHARLEWAAVAEEEAVGGVDEAPAFGFAVEFAGNALERVAFDDFVGAAATLRGELLGGGTQALGARVQLGVGRDCGGFGGWNTWYTRTANTGGRWIAAVRLSNLGTGAPYKTAAGYAFTDGDYFGLSVGPTGTNYVIWGEADGSSLYCCGGAWYTAGV